MSDEHEHEHDPVEDPAPRPRFPLAIISYSVRILLPIAVIAGTWFAYKWIVDNQPQARREQPPRPVAQVSVVRVQAVPFTVRLESRGTVMAETSSELVTQVSGVIISAADGFRDGGAFTAGEELIRLDPRDYDVALEQAQAAVREAEIAVEQARIDASQVEIEVSQYETDIKVARAAVIEAERALEEEEARAKQAQAEWRQLNGDRQAPDLVLRIPQLAAAQARLASAQAQLAQREADQGLAKPLLENAATAVKAREATLVVAKARVRQAELDLERTVIRAPYTGRIDSRQAHVGQYVNVGRTLATMFATDAVEVRLPLTNRQLAYVTVPNGTPATQHFSDVTLRGQFGELTHEWTGKIVRSDGAMDPTTRQLYVIARVESPYEHERDGRPPLRVGMFVTAEIEGRVLEDVFTVPRAAVRGDNELFIVDEDSMVMTRRKVEPLWSDQQVIVVRDELEDGELLCVSPVVFLGQTLPVQARWADSGELLDGAADAHAPQPHSEQSRLDATAPAADTSAAPATAATAAPREATP